MTKRVSLQINQEQFENIKKDFLSYEKPNKGEYIAFFAKTNDLLLTIYRSKKEGEFKVIFQGENPLEIAQKYDENASLVETKNNDFKVKTPSKACWLALKDQVGSDEVGTGDLFGPICVCATYVKKSDIQFLKSLGVDDSKRIKDDDIRIIGKELINRLEYSQVSLNNEKYNEVFDKKINMNEMKAKMHNQVLLNIKEKHPKVQMVVVDQFCSEENYYSYLFGTEKVVDKITFQTKAESYFPCVAAASIIARYSFLQKMDKLALKYGMEFPFGSSDRVTKFAKEFVKKFGKEELLKVVKKNFVNLKGII